MNVLRIIKINLLALVAFPLLLLATVIKLVAKAMEKMITIIGTALIVGGIALIFELAKNPGEFFQGIVLLIACLILGGVIIALVLLVLSLISAALMTGINLVIGVINAAYELLYAAYAGLYHICYEDYCRLTISGKAKVGSCFIYSLLRVVNRLIIFFATHALKVLIVLSLVIVGYSLISTQGYIKDMFGVGIFAYLKMFSVYEVIYGVVLYLAFQIGVVTLLISLGIEWSEWGEEMSLSTSDYEKYIQNVKTDYTAMNEERIGMMEDADKKRRAKCTLYMEMLNNHMDTFEAFLADIASVVEKSEDYVLRANRGQYITDLNDIAEALKKFEGAIPLEEFEKVMPQIDHIEKVKKKIVQQVEQIRKSQTDTSAVGTTTQLVAGGFFAGCNTIEKLDKRYKALCKTYHPDSDAGDEETFKLMQDEYERKKAEMQV